MTSLITINELKDLLSNPRLVLLDATIDKVNQPVDNTTVTLIPNSLFFDIEKDFSDHSSGLPHTVIDTHTFNSKVQKLGINQDSIIVIYDRWGVYSSPRAWWMFQYMGHQDVYVLNGGLPAWENHHLPTVNKHSSSAVIGNFQSVIQKEWFADKDLVLSQLSTDSTHVIDARGTGRFMGTTAEPRPGVRSGHIPNSTNLPFEKVLNGIYMHNPTVLWELLAPHMSEDGLNIFSCGSGITASILALAAKEADFNHISVYDGSWTEWGSDTKLPISN